MMRGLRPRRVEGGQQGARTSSPERSFGGLDDQKLWRRSRRRGRYPLSHPFKGRANRTRPLRPLEGAPPRSGEDLVDYIIATIDRTQLFIVNDTTIACKNRKMKLAKCPKCERSMSSATISTIPLSGYNMKSLNGIAYSCPHISCQTVISIGVDPLALETDTINGIVKALKNSR